MKAPFPYFGGKSTVAAEIWQRLGNVPNYVEPFFGSGAVLLSRPHAPQTETVNDFDGFLVNAWRALKFAPGETAGWADWPVSEQDLEARHYWLVTQGKERLENILSNPEGFDAKIAGWWIWGACCWIGSSWCKGDGPWALDEEGRWFDRKLPHVGNAGRGIHRQLPHVGNAGQGIHRKLPHVGDAGMGIHRKLPHVGDAGRGIHRQLPHVGNAGRGERIAAYFAVLSARLERVRIAHGDFDRVLGESVTIRHGVTGVFLDPPYLSDCDDVYTHSDTEPGRRAAAWCKENGDNPKLRIALCGYAGEHDLPGWTVYRWKAKGGYGSQGSEDSPGKVNRTAETIWFSPHCLRPMQADLFGGDQ